MGIKETVKSWAKRTKRDGLTLWFARKHPSTPWYAKALGLMVVAYALSPVDLIPDFIPVLGYLDDAVLLPVLILLTIRLLPADVLHDCRKEADAWIEAKKTRPRSLAGAALVVMLWLCAGAAVWLWFVQPRL